MVPEVNAADIGNHKLIANPNCTTAILVVALEPLRQAFGLKRVIVSTYQAASGAGAEGMAELEQEEPAGCCSRAAGRETTVFAHPLPFNVIPQIDSFQPNGYTREEMKVAWESRKIMGMPDLLPVSCTAVRIPTFRVHGEAVTIEVRAASTPKAAAPCRQGGRGEGCWWMSRRKQLYPMPITATGQDDVEAGQDPGEPGIRGSGSTSSSAATSC